MVKYNQQARMKANEQFMQFEVVSNTWTVPK